jgi:hypothetical protein
LIPKSLMFGCIFQNLLFNFGKNRKQILIIIIKLYFLSPQIIVSYP